MVSLLPALRVTRARLQPHLMNLGAGGSTLRFGGVWTTAMIAQVALTAIAIPIGIEGASQAILMGANPRAVSESRVFHRAPRARSARRRGL